MGKVEELLIYTNDNCIGCNKCIRVCSSVGACVSREVEGRTQIKVDPNRCVACGACIDVCEHNAREFRDDTGRFFDDLKKGESISVLVAPAFAANYPDEYDKVLGGLKKLGVKHIINVAFGADITTWSYLDYINKNHFYGGISQPCPAVVAYIERHIPELIPRLFPVHSPLLCAAIYARKYMGITDKLAFISPCIAKKLEIDDPNTEGYVSYNVTFDHLMRYVRTNDIYGDSVIDEIEYGYGCNYPTPGGLADNIRWFVGDEAFVRRMEGERRMYHYLEANKELLRDGKTPFTCVDALNCSGGCLYGTGCERDKYGKDDTLIALHDIVLKNKECRKEAEWAEYNSPKERFEALDRHFSKLNPEDFVRRYTDKSDECTYLKPTDEERDEIFKSMDKFTEDERNINCSCCGYDSCSAMADAIYNGFNEKANCIYYLRKESIEQRHKAEIAEKANEAKDVFLSNMSHEIRTPLNAVLGMNAMIMKETKEENVRGYSKQIRRAGKTLLSIINDILDISKLEAGMIELNIEKYSLPELINTVNIINRELASKKKLTLNLELENSVPEYVLGDESRIRQILSNILQNSIKYTETGHVDFKIRCEEAEGDNVNLVFTISDTGVGIATSDLENIFTKFQRFDVNKNRMVEGAGLGLALSKGYVDHMNGTIDIESEVGKGTIVTIIIPQERCSDVYITDVENDGLNREDNTQEKQLLAPGCRVLLVDDVPMNLVILSELLKASKMTVDMAGSGKEALQKTAEIRYDVILMDYMMPDMDGEETMRNIHSQENGLNRETPVIVQTANAVRGTKEQYLCNGFIDCLFKPIDPITLYDTLAIHLPKYKTRYE